jgi:hypothetical protein
MGAARPRQRAYLCGECALVHRGANLIGSARLLVSPLWGRYHLSVSLADARGGARMRCATCAWILALIPKVNLSRKQPVYDLCTDAMPLKIVLATTALVLLCHKRRTQQNGQQVSRLSRNLASLIRSVAIEYGLCRSARMRRAAGQEVGRYFLGA